MLANLLRAELLRVRYRKRVWVTLLIVFILGLLAPMLNVDALMPPSAEEVQRAVEDWQEYLASCPECTAETMTLADFLPGYHYTMYEVVEYFMGWFGLLLGAVALVFGAIYVASDFQSGAMTTQLTFTPRREAVLAARTLVTGLLGAVLAGLGSVAMTSVTLIWFIIGNGFDAVGNAHPLLEFMVGSVVLGFFMGASGALVAFMGGLVPVLGSLALFLGAVQVSLFWTFDSLLVQHLLPHMQAQALIIGRVPVDVWTPDVAGGTYLDHTVYLLRWEACLYFTTWLVVLAVAAWLLFRRRDVRG